MKKIRLLVYLILVVGIGMLAYPTFSNWWNSMHQSQMIAGYVEKTNEISNQKKDEILKEAEIYNNGLKKRNLDRFNLTKKELDEYNKLLNVTDTGIMAVVNIPKINVKLPIYHTTTEGVLQIAVGHIPGSSLPIGGKGSHCVLSGHTGLVSSKLFTDLDKLKKGDIFTIKVMDRTLTYKVDKITVVLPTEINDLEINDDMDYVTLQTCTPYGVNSHRLLVRGERIPNISNVQDIENETKSSYILYIILAISIFLLILLILITKRKK